MSTKITRRNFLAAAGATVGVSFLNWGDIVWGATPPQKALGTEFANALVPVPTEFKGLSDSAVKKLRPDIADILKGLPITKGGKRITPKNINSKDVDNIIEASAKATHNIQESLYSLGAIHPLEDDKQAVVNYVNRGFFAKFLELPEDRRDTELPKATDLKKALLSTAAKKGITAFDENSSDYRGWELRIAYMQFVVFWATIKKVKPENFTAFVRKYAEQFELKFGQQVKPGVLAGGVVPLNYTLTDWEIGDWYRRRNLQITCNAVMANKGKASGVVKTLAKQGITVDSAEVSQVAKWFADLVPLCDRLERIDRIAKTCMLGDKPSLFLVGEVESHGLVMNFNLEAALMKVIANNNPLTFFPEAAIGLRKMFEQHYDMCHILSLGGIEVSAYALKGLFGEHWKEQCYPVDEKGPTPYQRSVIMTNKMSDYLSSPEGQAALQRGGRTAYWLGGAGHIPDFLNIGTRGQNDLFGELLKHYVPVSLWLGNSKSSFEYFDSNRERPERFNDYYLADILWWLFRDTQTQESFANSFAFGSAKNDEKMRSWGNVAPYAQKVLAVGSVGNSKHTQERKIQTAQWKRTFEPYRQLF